MLSTAPLDIKLDPTDWDLYVGPNGIEWVYGAEGVAQLIRITILLFMGEWFMNMGEGMPWYQEILGQKFDEQLLRRRLAERIVRVPAVIALTSLEIAFDAAARSVTVNATVQIKFDDTVPDLLTVTTTIGG